MKSIMREHDISPYCWSTLYWDMKAIDDFQLNSTLNSPINKAACDELYSYYSEVSMISILDGNYYFLTSLLMLSKLKIHETLVSANTDLFTVYDMDLSFPILNPNKTEISFPGQGRQWCKSEDIEKCTKNYFNCLSSKISAIPDKKKLMCYRETFCKILNGFTAHLENWPHGSWSLKYKITAVYKEFLGRITIFLVFVINRLFYH